MAVRGNWKTLPGTLARPGVVRKAFGGKNSTVTLNELKPGTQPNVHSHPHEQITYILQGEGEFVLGGEVMILTAGDLLLVPPNVPHSMKVIGSETVLNLDVFSPAREDYV